MKVATMFLKYDYGIEKRGKSLEKKVFLPSIKANVDEVVSFWLEENGYPEEIDAMQNRILEFCKNENPDVVFFVLMKNEIKKETLKELSKNHVTVNWFCDDQWRFENFTKLIAPYIQYSITMDKYSLNKFKKINSRVILSQWATNDYIQDINLKKTDYKYDISFVGGKNITREWYVYELEKSGYKVNCFGSGWDNGRVSFEEMNNIFLNSKINLNLSNSIPNDIRFYKYLIKKILLFKEKSISCYLKKVRSIFSILLKSNKNKKNIEQMKARNFEIPGFGGFEISQYSLELEDYYEIGKEIAIFSNIDELKLNIDYYLKNESIRKKMVQRAYLRTKDYTYEKRIEKIFEEVRNAKSLHSC